MHNNLGETKERWERDVLRPALAKAKERSAEFKTDSGIPVDRFYLPVESSYEERLGFPGEYPFVRGIHPVMYRNKFWTMRQYAGFGTAEESNHRYRYLIAHGTTGLSVAFDLPTQMGYDSDHPVAEGEVGKVGVAINSLDDMEVLFDGIDLEKVTTSMTINATAPILLCLYVALARRRGGDVRKLSGTVQNDILKEFAARGTYIYPAGPSMRLVTDVIQWTSSNLPRWNPISISGYHMREAGATAVQEIAFTIANARAYVDAAIQRGLPVDSFAGRLSFFFNAHNNFLEEVAKFRAARRIWSRLMRDTYGAKDPESLKLRFHAQTGGATLTAQQIDNNVVRVTVQALAAILGGCQSLHTNSRDEALALPAEDSARLALRTQQVLAHETGVADTVDPLGGSYYVEYLTDEIERSVWKYLSTIENAGGAVKAIEKGYYQNEIAESAYRYQMAIERKEKVVVGVNEFQEEEEKEPPLLRIDDTVRVRQIERLNRTRKERNGSDAMQALEAVAKAAQGSDNLMPHLLGAVEARATVGEISDTLRKVWGEFRE